MKHLFIILMLIAFSFALIACGTAKKVVQQETQNKSVETKYERIYIRDTVMLEIPHQISSVVTPDTTSTLENDFAISKASIDTLGRLHHLLETKQQEKPVPTDKEIIYRDSIVYVDKEVEVPVMVEKDLTAWQEFRLKWFNALVAVLLALLIWTFRTPLKNLIRRFI